MAQIKRCLAGRKRGASSDLFLPVVSFLTDFLITLIAFFELPPLVTLKICILKVVFRNQR
jgi:hypothetical protein